MFVWVSRLVNSSNYNVVVVFGFRKHRWCWHVVEGINALHTRRSKRRGKINLFKCSLIRSILITSSKNVVYFGGPLSMFAVLTSKVQRSLVIALPCDYDIFGLRSACWLSFVAICFLKHMAQTRILTSAIHKLKNTLMCLEFQVSFPSVCIFHKYTIDAGDRS